MGKKALTEPLVFQPNVNIIFFKYYIILCFIYIHPSIHFQGSNYKPPTMVMANPSLLLQSFFFFFLLPCLSSSCPEYQKQALLQFKSSILAIHSSFHALDSWNSSSSNCCLWDKVTCSSPSNSNSTSTPSVVIGLNLSYLFAPLMSFSLLAPLFFIKSLRVLDISHNSINGQIPAIGFGNLINLVHLDLSTNSIYGQIPALGLGNLSNLVHLDLSWNSIEGQIPALGFGNLSNLVHLDLSMNFIYGQIPLQLFQLKYLRYLDFGSNEL